MSQTSKVLYFAYLLMLLASQLCFCLISLTIDLAINKAKSMDKKNIISFLEYAIWKKRIGFFRC